MKWTKRIDVMHQDTGKIRGRTDCGKAMLGNNYAKEFPERKKCKTCFKEE